MDANVLALPKSHRDYTNYYISVVDDDQNGYNVQIKPLEYRTATCDTCGERRAEYWLDASDDLGTASASSDQCQQCTDWAFDHQFETGDVFHLQRWVDADRATLIAMLREQGWNDTQFSVMDDEDLRAEVLPYGLT